VTAAKSVGIVSRHYGPTHPTGTHYRETDALQRACAARFDRVVTIAPDAVTVLFERGAATPRVWHASEEISDLSVIVARDIRECESIVAALVHALELCGCVSADPPERFTGSRASKARSTVERFTGGTGTTTWIVGREGACAFHHDAPMPDSFVIKPARGRRGDGLRLVSGRAAAERALGATPGRRGESRDPLILQEFIDFVDEWRVLLLDGRALGVARKVAVTGSIARNAGRGSAFAPVDRPDVSTAVEAAYPGPGVRGVDVAEDRDGNLHVIEANWAPGWHAFAGATGIDVADEIAKALYLRVESRSSPRPAS
jgi:glutathione synthase/RimK-type ligase-like ATP-grasp enzyme